jgi:YHS domain-containing protein
MKSEIHEHKKNTLLNVSKKQFLIVLMAVLSASTFAQTSKSAKLINTENGVAIQGYDPVAYFESNKAIKGNEKITATFQDATYYFSSKKNKVSFLKNPNHFIPQYGGYCAYGMSFDHDAPIDPKSFAIIDNKLFLNYSSEVNELWLNELADRMELADKNWLKREKL